MISTPLMMENPVRSPMVPPMRLSWASVLIFLSLSTLFIRTACHSTISKFFIFIFISLHFVKGRRVKVDLHQLQGWLWQFFSWTVTFWFIGQYRKYAMMTFNLKFKEGCKETLQELRTLSSVILNCRVTNNVMNPGSQLS